ncbi:hypothetical protein LTR74_013880 [Friedmanniomyces endolithicus]|nr:hypothetical protein LTR74_013880 [Friedmanniomyces endolithicus]
MVPLNRVVVKSAKENGCRATAGPPGPVPSSPSDTTTQCHPRLPRYEATPDSQVCRLCSPPWRKNTTTKPRASRHNAPFIPLARTALCRRLLGNTTASSLIMKKTVILEERISVISSDLEATQQQLLDRRAELLAFNERLDRVAASMAGKGKKKVAGLSTPLPRTPSLRHDAQSDAAETPLPPTPPEKARSSWLGSRILGTGRAEEAQGPWAEKGSSGHPPGTLDPTVADAGVGVAGTDV